MKTRLVVGAALLLTWASPAHAHRLDEYLQATTIAVTKDRVSLQVRLAPGVAVFPSVLANMDTNGDGLLSEGEQRTYVERVLRDLSLSIDGDRVTLRLIASKFASVAEMKEGRGDIMIDIDAVAPRGHGERYLSFENRHLRAISVYLVNALVSRDPDIRFTHQNRNYQQSNYQLEYVQTGAVAGSPRGLPMWLGAAALLLMVPLAELFRRRFVTRIPPFATRI
ncbi:MAG: hypothetical protein JWL61_4516 [Gemmatimonadetes bacterium]|nr:hypothetical protein [Gemmatimonadota bacterium]